MTDLATSLRRQLSALAEHADADLRRLLRAIDSDVQAAMDGDDRAKARVATALHDLLPGLADRYQLAGAALAADAYDDERDRLEIPGRFTAGPVDLPDGGHALAGWALDLAKTASGLEALLSGGMSKRIMQSGNQTIMDSAIADPQSGGWQRQARGSGCYFCRMLAGRGAVYTEATADFASHDHCHCVAVSAWSGHPRPVKPYTPSPRNVSAADKRRAERWIEDHKDELDAASGGGVSAGGSGGTGGGTPFPKDQNGDDVPFAREDVEEWPDTWEHVWLGTPVDPGQGRHDPFHPPPVIDKTLFPKRWFGSSRDHQQAEAEIMAALHAADLIVERQGEGAWRMEGTHDGVRTVHIVKHKAGVPVLDAAWPKHGPGVGRVVATDPITVRWLT